MADMDAIFWKNRFYAVNSRISELEFENHKLTASNDSAIKQDPEDIAQLEDIIGAQKRMLMEAQITNTKLEQELGTEQQYVRNLKARVSAMEGAEKAMKTSSLGTKSTLAQEKKRVSALEKEIYDLKMERRDLKCANSRLKFDIEQLQEQNPGLTLNVSFASPKPSPFTAQSTTSPAFPTEKRKWDHVNSNAGKDPLPYSKTKSSKVHSDRRAGLPREHAA
ncbi:hypothetical protein CLAFUW4_03672 [Fulvia fulva]|uniref:Uncharacterized protein n=1 Tax=Passalora fulva TaxID=5499 RepID=A0A9Q8P4W5_PASFU|nr:uncharacterized protein CLAFUR5_03650 [Fulvia fulva]KAK4632185.1 hypothetical protein CLAFUR4_03660 [Fulvia fulva]KAK4633390.1 hypothetical protein CLAFUR0_03663 [Fulvia fulva]UJO13261.1 hypothetical protein CLAFUR5_03650 [Fulvia fulva]WPV11179.1 hypothetical protein CLAFUW4_03672 [Fulvia fulva]WPV25864.1 hypothetical protein CLAFUW7_03664 [Fulvia fulva]